MLSKPVPSWIMLGAFLLTAIAGSVNAVGFMGLHHQALSHMSGTATMLSTDVVRGNYDSVRHAGAVLFFFFLGCLLSGMIIRRSTLQMGPSYGIALTVESVLLFAAAGFLHGGSNYGDYLAAMACGLQNAMATTYSGAIVRTTHITGIVTDLGLAAGHFLRREVVNPRQIRIHLVLIAGFVCGGIGGGIAYQHWGVRSLLLPALITGLTGISYTLYRHTGGRNTTPAT